MGLITTSIPVSGQPNTTEDPKVASDIVTITNAINGNIDSTNLSGSLLSTIPGAWATYTPSWTSAGTTAPAIGNGSLSGSYQQFNHTCVFRINLVVGSTTTPGSLGLSFGLPVQASGSGEQQMLCKLYTASGIPTSWMGLGYIAAAASTVSPYFPYNANTSILAQLQNSDNTLASGTGVPLIGSSYPLTAGSNLVISGAYQTV